MPRLHYSIMAQLLSWTLKHDVANIVQTRNGTTPPLPIPEAKMPMQMMGDITIPILVTHIQTTASQYLFLATLLEDS